MIPIILSLIVACILFQNAVLSFKNGYYEQTLKNNKDSFTPTRWEGIEKVMKKKVPW